MCQSIPEGGRRCTIHRTDTRILFDVLSNAGVSRELLKSIFMKLENSARRAEKTPIIAQQYQHAMEELGVLMDREDAGSSFLLRNFLNRDESVDEDNQHVMFALSRLKDQTQNLMLALQCEFEVVAEKAGFASAKEASVEWDKLYKLHQDKDDYPPDFHRIEMLRRYRYKRESERELLKEYITEDKAAMWAFSDLYDRHLNSDLSKRRIQEYVTADPDKELGWHKMGFSPNESKEGEWVTGRLEVILSESSETVYAYPNVSEAIYQRLISGEEHTLREVMRTPYATAGEDKRDSVSFRCGACGRFRSVNNHDCPNFTPNIPISPLTEGEIPDPMELSRVEEINHLTSYRRDERKALEDEDLSNEMNSESLKTEYDMRMSMEKEASEHTGRRRGRDAFLHEYPQVLQNNEAYMSHLLNKWEDVEPGYGKNLELAAADIEEALMARERSTHGHLQPLTENVTDGICDPNVPGSRRFGLELEMVFPSNIDADQARQDIVDDLRALNLTSNEYISGYHSNEEAGYAEWVLEEDETVDAELVSPLLADTPETWRDVGLVLEIIRKRGGRPSIKAGSHVHVSTTTYEAGFNKHVDLIRAVNEHEQVLFRSACDPVRRTHRGTEWCGPMMNPINKDISDGDSGLYLSSGSSANLNMIANHQKMVNVYASADEYSESPHVEFRLWDASLDLATIQQQVATSVALVDYADRRVAMQEGISKPSRRSDIANVEDFSRDLSEEGIRDAMALSDKIFRRQSDRKRFMSMFAVGSW